MPRPCSPSCTPGSLLDAGTGTGVLALAAMRLGFAPVYAFDNDPEALVIAEENARRNGLRPLLFGADVTDAALELPHADTVVANITLEPLVALGARYSAALAAGRAHPRTVVLAGLLDEQLAPAAGRLRRLPRSAAPRSEGEWHCVGARTGRRGRRDARRAPRVGGRPGACAAPHDRAARARHRQRPRAPSRRGRDARRTA